MIEIPEKLSLSNLCLLKLNRASLLYWWMVAYEEINKSFYHGLYRVYEHFIKSEFEKIRYVHPRYTDEQIAEILIEKHA